MKRRFNIGDRVRCITLDKTGTITSVHEFACHEEVLYHVRLNNVTITDQFWDHELEKKEKL